MFRLTDEDQAFELDGHPFELQRTAESSWVVSVGGTILGTLAEVASPPERLEKTYVAIRGSEDRQDIYWPELLRWLLELV